MGDIEQALVESSEALLFRPTESQAKLKAKWLVRIEGNPAIDPSSCSRGDVERVLGVSVGKAWDNPEFRAWFLNTSEHKEQMEELAVLAHAAARSLLLSEEPKVQGARAQLIKFMLEYKSPRKVGTGQFMDKVIQNMDSAQLSLYLQKNGVSMGMEASKGPSLAAASPPSDTSDTITVVPEDSP
jgi:hypothetical protein